MRGPVLMVGLGEILWDLLPTGRVLGGAPTNFAYMANVLGNVGIVASRVGVDDFGYEARQRLDSLGVSGRYLQTDCHFPTGTAEVSVDSHGQPNFTIRESVAWDSLQWTEQWEELSGKADVICFGTLAQRTQISADTIDRFLRNSKPSALRIFDANLRQSFYNPEILKRSLAEANIVKLSEQELSVVSSQFGWAGANEERLALRLIEEWQVDLVCVTRGSRGSLLLSRQERASHPGFEVTVVDAVGAGDAFTACLAHYYVGGHRLSEIAAYANRLASWVASQPGATPAITGTQVQNLLQDRMWMGDR